MKKLFLPILILFVINTILIAQLKVKDQDSTPHTLMQVIDEGSAGSILFYNVGSPSSNTYKLYRNGNKLYWGADALGIASSAGGWNDDGSVVRLSLSSDKVGIGTFFPPEKLVVKMDGTTWNDAHFALEASATADKWDFTVGASNTYFIGYNEGTKMVVTTEGNVGIGTYAPASKLSVGGDGDINTTIYGTNTTSENGRGIYGAINGNNGQGVYGYASGSSSTAIYGWAASGGSTLAGHFAGDVNITGMLYKGGGSFKIDHPLDPTNKNLYHSFVESPDMMNIYNGNIVTNGNNEAVVELPDWFEPLNKDFRYQLTVIGEFAQAIIKEKINNNQFTIMTDKPNIEVSWQVTGIRHDAFANANRIPVEEYKKEKYRGKYLHPEAFGLSDEMSVDFDQKLEPERKLMNGER